MKAAEQVASGSQPPALLCIGHRGAMGHEPENTLRSFRKALELGAPCIELDVYWVDDHLIVIHDDRLERTTNGTGLVTEQSFDYLRSLDAGKGELLPTLAEVCALIEGKASVNIELKGPGTAAPVAEYIATLVDAGWDKNTILVSSFSDAELRIMRQLDTEIRLGIIIHLVTPGDFEFAESIGAYSIHPAHEFLNPALVNQAHACGLKVYPYTVNKPSDIVRMHQMGIDGVFTNFPERVLEHYAQGKIQPWLL